MCLWEKPYYSIRNTIQRFTPDQKEEENVYWINEFNQEFPGGDGLEPTIQAYVQHYKRKQGKTTDSSSDESEDSDNVEDDHLEDDCDAVPDAPGFVHDNLHEANATRGNLDIYYQTSDDLLLQPTTNSESINMDIDNPELATMAEEYIANARLDDLMKWLPDGENPSISRIEMTFTQMKDTNGDVVPVYATRPLTLKQEMVRRIIMNWVNDRISDRNMKPLRLFVLGLPGVGKTFAFKVTATQLISSLGDDWQKMVRFATPTGSVSFHMGFNAQTLHRTFYIRVGKETEVLDGLVDQIVEVQKRLPSSIILIAFDECSMIARQLFGVICSRLELAGLILDDIGLVLFGDPAQTPPINGVPIWSTDEGTIFSMKGMADFRNLFGMKPISELKEYRKLKKKFSPDYAENYQKFRNEVFDGTYNDVYRDQTMRTYNSLEFQQLKQIQTNGRYENFSLTVLA